MSTKAAAQNVANKAGASKAANAKTTGRTTATAAKNDTKADNEES